MIPIEERLKSEIARGKASLDFKMDTSQPCLAAASIRVRYLCQSGK
jgi:hypothetical protein